MVKITLEVTKRTLLGRKVKTLRKEGLVPANIFGKNIKSNAIQLKKDDFVKVYEKAGETGIVDLKLDKKENPVLIHHLQKDPVSDEVLHIDFLQVDLKEKVTADVPVETIGESPAEKQGLGTVVVQIDEIEVEALPTDLPEKFEVDLGVLTEVDQAIHIKDLKVDAKKVKILENLDEIVVKVEPLEKVEEVTPPPTAEGMVEGEAPAEGQAPVPEGETSPEAQPQEEKKEESSKK